MISPTGKPLSIVTTVRLTTTRLAENILPASNAAPSLIANQKELEMHMRADSLNDKLSHRPDPQELVKEGVLKEDPRTADDKYAEAIEDEYAKREGGA